MSKNKGTNVVIVLDKSGSMMGSEASVISALNEFFKQQQAVKGKAEVSLLLFNQACGYSHKDVKIKKFPVITKEDFRCDGMTALNDAIGMAISDVLAKGWKKNIIVVQTDGLENTSYEYTKAQVTQLIKENEENIEVIFIGAGIDVQQGTERGMHINKTMSVTKSTKGMSMAYGKISGQTAMYRGGTVDKMDVSGDTEED